MNFFSAAPKAMEFTQTTLDWELPSEAVNFLSHAFFSTSFSWALSNKVFRSEVKPTLEDCAT